MNTDSILFPQYPPSDTVMAVLALPKGQRTVVGVGNSQVVLLILSRVSGTQVSPLDR